MSLLLPACKLSMIPQELDAGFSQYLSSPQTRPSQHFSEASSHSEPHSLARVFGPEQVVLSGCTHLQYWSSWQTNPSQQDCLPILAPQSSDFSPSIAQTGSETSVLRQNLPSGSQTRPSQHDFAAYFQLEPQSLARVSGPAQFLCSSVTHLQYWSSWHTNPLQQTSLPFFDPHSSDFSPSTAQIPVSTSAQYLPAQMRPSQHSAAASSHLEPHFCARVPGPAQTFSSGVTHLQYCTS